MELYIKAELPETCYIHEAALWVALGIVPKLHYGADGRDIRRVAEDHLDHMEALVDADGYDIGLSIDSVISEADGKAFLEAINLTYGRSIAEIKEHIDKLERQLSHFEERTDQEDYLPRLLEDYRLEIEQDRRALEAAKSIEPYVSRLEQLTEVGQAKVFAALASGQLHSSGIKVSLMRGNDANGDPDLFITGKFSPVPHEEWRLNAVKWKHAHLSVSYDEFGWVGVQVSTSELLTAFPRPELRNIQLISGTLIGGALVVESDREMGTGAFKRPRGRQLLGDGAIAKAVDEEFRRRLSAGVLPKVAESIIQDAIVFSNETFGGNLSRTTAQRYLAEVLLLARKSRP